MKLFGAKEICLELGISLRRLDYLQFYAKIPTPKKNFAGHRIYTIEDLKLIRKVELETRNNENKSDE
jgi:DNA-binding transcriptional MerR regulator|tara:strand:+ start:184 stop:384 length:201 start_codon:yes stop_codon:yes gene_type:complete